MSDNTPSPELLQVDPDLMRRVAWGLIAGRSKAAIAADEGLTAEECALVCTAPGMFSIMNVWVNFLERRKSGGRKNTRKLTGWCVDHVFEHAPERLNRNEVWRPDRLSSVMLHYGFAIVFGWMLGFLDGVMGAPGARRKVLDDFRQNLVDLLCWAVEVTFREKMLEQYSVDLLIARDGAFQAAIAGREFFETGIGSELGTFEEAVAAGAYSQSADGSTADTEMTGSSTVKTMETSAPLSPAEVAESDEAAPTIAAEDAEPLHAAPIARDKPVMARRRPRSARPSMSRPAVEPAIRPLVPDKRVPFPCVVRPDLGRGRVPIRPPPRWPARTARAPRGLVPAMRASALPARGIGHGWRRAAIPGPQPP